MELHKEIKEKDLEECFSLVCLTHKHQYSRHMETSQLISSADQYTGYYMNQSWVQCSKKIAQIMDELFDGIPGGYNL